ncbi:MAG TPA: ATP-binding cassette domain-containing protein, partial [Actinomycetota bacterium]|nr:ATP-binding cassette domain-containing protein [Actinomycetota bacterium]
MDELAVQTEGLAKAYGDVHAVDGVDLEVERGEIYGFLGPNGAGKTTVIRMLSTLLAPTSGRAWVAGHNVVKHPDEVRLRIGLALQEAALDDKQTGIEILRLQGRLYGLRRSEIDARVKAITSLVDIGEALGRRIGTYSGGMKRRLDLAAALVHNPEVLFLDEPTTGLDPVSRTRVWEEVRHLNERLGMTIFLTTQYLQEADNRRLPGHHQPGQDRGRRDAGRPEAAGGVGCDRGPGGGCRRRARRAGLEDPGRRECRAPGRR